MIEMKYAYDLIAPESLSRDTIDTLRSSVTPNEEAPPVSVVEWAVSTLGRVMANGHGCPAFIVASWGSSIGEPQFHQVVTALESIGNQEPEWNVEARPFPPLQVFNGLAKSSPGLADAYADCCMMANLEDLARFAIPFSRLVVEKAMPTDTGMFLIVALHDDQEGASEALIRIKDALVPIATTLQQPG